MTAASVAVSALRELLEGGSLAAIRGASLPRVVVHVPLGVAPESRVGARTLERLETFRELLRAAVAPLELAFGGVELDGAVASLPWEARGVHVGPLLGCPATGRALVVRARCRLRFERDKLAEVWVDVDLHDLLEQLGRLCSAPGEASPGAVATNRAALALVTRALTAAPGAATDDAVEALDGALVTHARATLYVSAAFEASTLAHRGTGGLRAVARALGERFDAVELALDAGVSQGATTTFRGDALVTTRGERFRYTLRCGLRAGPEHAVECWIEIAPPPSLREHFA